MLTVMNHQVRLCMKARGPPSQPMKTLTSCSWRTGKAEEQPQGSSLLQNFVKANLGELEEYRWAWILRVLGQWGRNIKLDERLFIFKHFPMIKDVMLWEDSANPWLG